jgi:dimethylhistidine N-methyltransferase
MAIQRTAARPLHLTPLSPLAQFREDVLCGLAGPEKTLPCKYLYDERGSALFDRICDLPEYYLTRTEIAILRRYGDEMAAAMGNHCLVIEYGSGSSLKTPLLLDHLRQPAGYVPVDISREHLEASATILARQFPSIEVLPVWADFTTDFDIPDTRRQPRKRAVFFPGSTIGNFGPADAVKLMKGVARLCGPRGGFLVGVDLEKPREILLPAYNDAAGVTAAFNKNLLVRINRELGANFDLDQFEHRAILNERHSRIEMHLVSRKRQVVRIGRSSIWFSAGETICTEHSYKFTRDMYREMAMEAGLALEQVWTDDAGLFSVQYLTVE